MRGLTIKSGKSTILNLLFITELDPGRMSHVLTFVRVDLARLLGVSSKGKVTELSNFSANLLVLAVELELVTAATYN